MNNTNVERFPNNIFLPDKKIIQGNEYNLYSASFSSLYDLYLYLKNNPIINSYVFTKLSSVENGYDFAGMPYDDAVEDLLNPNDENFKEFLDIVKTINSAKLGDSKKYRTVKSYTGSRIHNTAFITGNPKCYTKREKLQVPKFIKMSINLAYNCSHDKSQVYYRSIIISNLVKALEAAGYSVSVNTFSLIEENSEMMKISIKMKNHNGKLHMSDLYKMTCNVEFFRRIIFRVMETLDVKDDDWCFSYGRTCSKETIKELLKLSEDDILFNQPNEMGIKGEDLTKDFKRAIEHLGLEDIVDVDKAIKTLDSKEVQMMLSKRMR